MKINYTFEKKQMLCTFWAVLASLLLPLGAWAETKPLQDSKGYYLISNADELLWFRDQVNSGNTTINVKLTANIDLTDIDFKGVGDTDHTFSGHFDGQFHSISNMQLYREESVIGFFRYAGGGAIIENLIIDATSSIESGKQTAGGIVGICKVPGSLTIRRCGNEATVTAPKVVAGILGCMLYNGESDELHIVDCYNCGNVFSKYKVSMFCGQIDIPQEKIEIKDCWNCGNLVGEKIYSINAINNRTDYTSDSQYKVVGSPIMFFNSKTECTNLTDEELANGALTSMLNKGKTDGTQVWYQKIGVDEHPVFAKTADNTVYRIEDLACDGKTTNSRYSNSNDLPIIADHDEAKVGDDDNYDIVCQNCKATLRKCFHYDKSDNTVTVTKNQEGAWYADSEIHLSDSYDYTSPVAFIARSVSYTRTMSNNYEYGSLILPFEAMSDENVTLYSLAEVNDDNVTFQKAETIEAGTPCIFRVNKGENAVITGESVTLSAMTKDPVDGPEGDMQMHGTYQKLTGQTNLWFLAKDALYYSSTAPVTLLPFRSWLTGSAPSPAAASSMRNIFIEEEGMTTAIECINNQAESVHSCTYDLQGRLVKNQKSGFMIQNGKKVLVGSK